MPSKLYGLDSEVLTALANVFSSYNKIKKVILYGSRAKGTFKAGSDIDLVLIAPSMSFGESLAVGVAIDELDLPYRVDLSLFHLITNQDLLGHIDRCGLVFYVNHSSEET